MFLRDCDTTSHGLPHEDKLQGLDECDSNYLGEYESVYESKDDVEFIEWPKIGQPSPSRPGQEMVIHELKT